MNAPVIASLDHYLENGWSTIQFKDIEGWRSDNHLVAFECLKRSAFAQKNNEPLTRPGTVPSVGLQRLFSQIATGEISCATDFQALEFFEEYFTPLEIRPSQGFVTGYYEPEVAASRIQSKAFSVPLYARPDDLVDITDQNRPEGWPEDMVFGRKTSDGLAEYFNRGEIETGALENRRLELFWLPSFAEAFFIHVQGSARLKLEDGTITRVAYAGKSGHEYTSIGKLLIERGIVSAENASMQFLRNWISENSQAGIELMRENKSFIFFSELTELGAELGPLAGAGVQLETRRSLAVDKSIHAYGTPVWISTENPIGEETTPFYKLMVAQDTGSAIIGPQRGDLFIGSGLAAGEIAGTLRHDCRFIILFAREN